MTANRSRWVSAVLWLCGSLLGMAAYLVGFGFRISGPLTWALALICALVALPINATVHLTFSLWGAFELGHWIVAAITACLYHGTVAIVLGRIYRRKPSDALAIGGAILALHLILYFFWQDVSPALSD